MTSNKKDKSGSQNETGFETEGPGCNISFDSKKELELQTIDVHKIENGNKKLSSQQCKEKECKKAISGQVSLQNHIIPLIGN